MTDDKRRQLLAAARAARPAEPPQDFSASVLRALERESRGQPAPNDSLFNQLANWFPRLATAAMAIIVIALFCEFYFDGDLAWELAELSEQWLLPVEWL